MSRNEEVTAAELAKVRRLTPKTPETFHQKITRLYDKVTWKQTHHRVLDMLIHASEKHRQEFVDWYIAEQKRRVEQERRYYENARLEAEDASRYRKQMDALIRDTNMTDEEISAQVSPVFWAGKWGPCHPNWVAMRRRMMPVKA